MRKSIIILFSMILLHGCAENDEGFLSFSGLECHGNSMFGTWSLVDSIKTTYLDNDSTVLGVFEKEMVFYDNGTGKLVLPTTSTDHFFAWILQCDPDVLTINTPFNNADSLFHSWEFFSINPYTILVNEVDFKRLILETSISPLNQKRVSVIEMNKKR